MGPVYYKLALKTKQKLPKVVNFKYRDCDLTQMNQIFNETLKNARFVKNCKWKKSIQILKLLDKIIPDRYFGMRHHRKLFYKVVSMILTQSAFECIYSSTLTKGYCVNSVPWLCKVRNSMCETVLRKANIFLLETVVKPLITFHYKAIKTYNGHEVQFIWLDNWCSYQNRALAHLKKSGALVEIKDMKEIEARGYLKIIPKGPLTDLNFRPVVNSFRFEERRAFMKFITKKIYEAARQMNKLFSPSLYKEWTSFMRRANGKDINGVKMDVEDAFGNVQINHLLDAIEGISSEFLVTRHKTFLLEYVQNQFVIFKKKVYQWKRGLLQGDVLSAALCELYMTFYDKRYLGRWGRDSFFHRTVDDYFFCSTEPYKVKKFQNYLQSVHKINKKKTKSTLDSHHELPYCGNLFDFKTKQVKSLYNFSDGYEIRHKFKLWNFRRPQNDALQFLHKSLSFSFISSYLGKMEMNTVFNSQRIVLENFFDAMVYVAYKFDATVMALRRSSEDFHYIYAVMNECIKKCAIKVRKVILQNKGPRFKVKVTIRLLKIIALKAFLVVLKRRNEVYKNLISKIKNENNLKVDFRIPDIDFKYFHRLPPYLRKVKISRKIRIK